MAEIQAHLREHWGINAEKDACPHPGLGSSRTLGCSSVQSHSLRRGPADYTPPERCSPGHAGSQNRTPLLRFPGSGSRRRPLPTQSDGRRMQKPSSLTDLSAHHQLGAQRQGHTEKDWPPSFLIPCPQRSRRPLAAQRPLGVLGSGLGCLLAPKGVRAPLWFSEGLFPQLTDKCGVFLFH